MNQNFKGEPDRDDIRMLENLRNQLVPMIKKMDRLQGEMEFKLNRGEVVDCGGYRHQSKLVTQKHRIPSKDAKGNIVLDASGKEVLVDRDIRRRIATTQALPTNTSRFEALHPFPNPLFPMNAGGGMAAGMAGTLLRKRLEPMEEGWVEERIRKASEWVYVPEEWGIEPKKPDAAAIKQTEDEDEDEVPESERLDSEAIPTTRVKDALSADDIKKLWQHAHQEVFDMKYLRQLYPKSYPAEDAQDLNEEEEEEEEGDEDEEEDDEEFEDVMDTSGGQEAVTEDIAKPKVVKKKVVSGKLPVHQPVEGVPVLSMGYVYGFAESGEK
ncbi:conserved hypothetical protein [Pyrenophora tritici-repentis Pt-1C-BFP]|uniref:Uncharacterized protein n=1 Tax=Pyrenophora tritici-repentis (strain Pt-1C-BFP) TaxID=426418 RepID=B2WBV6_PYRTR|nr:uncharacterized protein PTRG_07119 [Pyrenophora tritici-repentis Pt-1C-BFP]EDU50038.1 conserved hypothetical protein [Pyrenophora tritici-repentis Pt-1C-BFP]